MNEEFGENLRRLRIKKGYTQEELARSLRISRSTYAGYEAKKRTPDYDRLMMLAGFLGSTLDELLGYQCPGKVENPSMPGLQGIVSQCQAVREAAQYYTEEETDITRDYFARADCAEYEMIEGTRISRGEPLYEHQVISQQIVMKLYSFLHARCKRCEVIPAPFCVVLDEKRGTVVQPDISVVCNPDFLKKGACYGAPDVVMEITSSKSARYDYCDKLNLYYQYGVREYWIIDPEAERIMLYPLEGGATPCLIPFAQQISSSVIKGFTLNLGKLLRDYQSWIDSDEGAC